MVWAIAAGGNRLICSTSEAKNGSHVCHDIHIYIYIYIYISVAYVDLG